MVLGGIIVIAFSAGMLWTLGEGIWQGAVFYGPIPISAGTFFIGGIIGGVLHCHHAGCVLAGK